MALDDSVAENLVVIPRVTVDTDDALDYGRVVRLAITCRVKGVSFDEKSSGELKRTAKLAVEDVAVISDFDRSEQRDNVGGQATAQRRQTPEEADGIGITLNRTGDLWSGDEVDPEVFAKLFEDVERHVGV